MEEKTSSLLLNLFQTYYHDHSGEVVAPTDIVEREFAFVAFEGSIMYRHISIHSLSELRERLVSDPPLHAFYSSAYYERPFATRMEDKAWLGTDLIFDIDIDHIVTPCKLEHDKWTCSFCFEEGGGMPPARCPSCGRESLRWESWVCEKCLATAKNETVKLVDFIMNDFGFSEEKITLAFSGHRGFHLHIEEPEIRTLNQDGRREILDFIQARGFDYGVGFPPGMRRFPFIFMDLRDPSWYGRLARGFADFFRAPNKELLTETGVTGEEAEEIVKRREDLSRAFSEGVLNWRTVSFVSEDTWRKILRRVLQEQAPTVDDRVTIDLKRLIRLIGSLHGKTGLKVVGLRVQDLDLFDPVQDAVVFSDEPVKIYAKKLPEKVLGESFHHVEEEIVHVPLYISVYLMGNGAECRMIS